MDVDFGVPEKVPSPPSSPDSEESQGSGEQPLVAEWDMGFRFKGSENVPYPLPSKVRNHLYHKMHWIPQNYLIHCPMGQVMVN